MVKYMKFVILFTPSIFILLDAITTFFVLVHKKGIELNFILSDESPNIILIMNFMFSISILATTLLCNSRIKNIIHRKPSHSKLEIETNSSYIETRPYLILLSFVFTLGVNRMLVSINNLFVYFLGVGFFNILIDIIGMPIPAQVMLLVVHILIISMLVFMFYPLIVKFYNFNYLYNIEILKKN